jgi:hypothetical protein
MYHSFRELLEAGWAPKKARWAGDPLKLPHAGDCESGVWACPRVQNHLPKSSCEIYSEKNCAARFANLSDAFAYVFHRIFICE